MNRHFSLIALCSALLFSSGRAAVAQPDALAPLDWVPAGFAGALRLEVPTPDDALRLINLGFLVTSVFQPNRTPDAAVEALDPLFPLSALDLEAGAFDALVLPWLDNELVVGYPGFDAALNAAAPLLILPTERPFAAITALRPALEAQDFLTTEPYRGVTLYEGDRAAIAFTPGVVLIGQIEHVRAAIDAGAAAVPGLTDTAVYQQVDATLAAALPRRAGQMRPAPLTLYLTGDAAARAPRLLLSQTDAADPLYDALVAAAGGALTPEMALLSGAVDALAIAVSIDPLALSVRADVVLHTSAPLAGAAGEFDAALFGYLPRSAMFVQAGAAARVRDGAVAALPLANFAGIALSAFPVDISAGAQRLAAPSAEEVQAAVDGLLAAAGESGVNLRGDLLENLTGGYVFALIPRPNNPTPTLNTPYDALLIARTADPAAYEALMAAARLFIGGVEAETLDIRGERYTGGALMGVGGAAARAQRVGDLLIVGTGDAVPLALAAGAGDNRLIDQARWQALNRDGVSYLYVDLAGMFAVFFPSAAAGIAGAVAQMGVTSAVLGDDLLYARALAVLG